MGDINKSKEELIKELQELRLKYDSLSALMNAEKGFHLSNQNEYFIKEDILVTEEINNPFGKLFENIDEVFWIRTDDKMIYVSPAFEKIWGYSSQALYENPKIFTDSIHPEDKLFVLNIFETKYFQEKTLFDYEYRVIKEDKKIRWINAKSLPVFDNNGKVIKRVGIIKDITEIKLTEEALSKSEERNRLLTDVTIEGILIHKNAVSIDLNQSLARIFGYEKEELLNKDFMELIHEDDKFIVRENIDNEITQPYQIRAIKKSGEIFFAEIESKNFNYKDEKWRVSAIRDVTDRRKAEQELIRAKTRAEESDRLKSAFLANLSHEIRTPMNGILGFAELLKELNLTGDEQEKYIEVILKSGNRMLNIINDIVDISKIDSGIVDVKIEDVDINKQLEYVYTFFKPVAEEKEIELSFKTVLQNKKAVIKTDKEKLIAILSNLVKNAVKYTDKGSIDFGYAAKENFIEFFVKDTGIGIPKDRQKAIFERFVQADILDRMAKQGAGLGLSITKSYVGMLGGEIRVESEEGKGSVFYFTIPYNTNQPKEKINGKHLSLKKGIPAKKLKLLIVEDDETSDLLINIKLAKYCGEILHTNNGKNAVNICQSNPDIDLVMMDIKMPVMDGNEATRQIRKFNRDVIIIAQTAHGLTGDKEKAIEAGCNDHISKPIKNGNLTEIINKFFTG
jgi:PAS domain S-box-containing protein